MKSYSKITTIVCLLLWAALSSLQAGAVGVEDAPTSVFIDYMKELYEGVTFDHEAHTDMYVCASCHHHTTGDGSQNDTCKKCHAESAATDDVSCSGCHKQNAATAVSPSGKIENTLYHIDKPGLKGALHLQCVGCHQVESGPVGCQECHVFTSEGRKRFALED